MVCKMILYLSLCICGVIKVHFSYQLSSYCIINFKRQFISKFESSGYFAALKINVTYCSKSKHNLIMWCKILSKIALLLEHFFKHPSLVSYSAWPVKISRINFNRTPWNLQHYIKKYRTREIDNRRYYFVDRLQPERSMLKKKGPHKSRL